MAWRGIKGWVMASVDGRETGETCMMWNIGNVTMPGLWILENAWECLKIPSILKEHSRTWTPDVSCPPARTPHP